MASRRRYPALEAVLLFLLFVRCASDHAERNAARPIVGASTPPQGQTAGQEGGDAIGEAQEVPKDLLDRLEERAQKRSTPPPPPEVLQRAPTPPTTTAPSDASADLPKSEPAPADVMPIAKVPPLDEGAAVDGKKGKEKIAPAKNAERWVEKPNQKQGDKAPRPVLTPILSPAKSAQILVFGESGRREAIKPRAVRVVAYVQGPRARTVVDYVFENPYDRRLEGTFIHPMPGDASPAGFAMFDGTRRVPDEAFFRSAELLPDLPKSMIEPEAMDALLPRSSNKAHAIDWGRRKDARVVEQKRAREVYEAVVRENVDPGLLEWSGGNNFEARVFPLEPKSLKRVVVAYEQPLLFDDHFFRYSYTLPEAQTIKERTASLFVDTTQGTVAGPPDPVRTARFGKWTRFDVRPDKGPYALKCAVEPRSRNVALRGKDTGGLGGEPFYAEVRHALSKVQASSSDRALFVIDTSLSAEDGAAYGRRTKMIRKLLEHDTSIRRYAVLLFDVRARWLGAPGWRTNDLVNREETVRALEQIYLEGATSFASVLDELGHQRGWLLEGGRPEAFLFSDGEITWGMDRTDELARRYPIIDELRWITYRFGEEPVNRELFDFLSTRTKGQTVAVLSESELSDAASAHRNLPAELMRVRVVGSEAADMSVAGDPRLVYPGQTLRIAGRLLDPARASLVVTLKLGEQTDTIEVPLLPKDKAETDELAPRAWAELYTKKLLAFDDGRLDRMVVALSQHYRLANPRASFLVLEREEDYQRFAIADVKVDLSNLETLRKQEQDSRRDRALGIALDGVDAEGLIAVDIFKKKTDGLPPFLHAEKLVDAPAAGGPERQAAEAEYRAARDKEKLDDLLYDRIGRVRALAGDTAGALRALSCTVELRPKDTEAMRLVGYALLALAEYGPATEVFERVRLRRPFEGEAYLEEAIALDALGRLDEAARNYEIVLARTWARHDREVRVVAAYHYARLIQAVLATGGRLSDEDKRHLMGRLSAIHGGFDEVRPDAPIDLQLTTLWSTDDIDIDLWVYEPNGEKCYYGHRDTELGGHLYWDVTDGLGPELYQTQRASSGAYETMVHYYGSRAPRLSAPTAMLMVVDKKLFTPEGASSRRFQMRLLPKRDAVLMMRTDVF